MAKSEPERRLEIFTGAGRRRSWSAEQKAQIIAESVTAGASVSAVARRHGLTPQQLFAWRRQARSASVVEGVPELRIGGRLASADRDRVCWGEDLRVGRQ